MWCCKSSNRLPPQCPHKTEEKSIKELSWDYHFCDISFFCRYFKQHTGLTPQQFRKT